MARAVSSRSFDGLWGTALPKAVDMPAPRLTILKLSQRSMINKETN